MTTILFKGTFKLINLIKKNPVFIPIQGKPIVLSNNIYLYDIFPDMTYKFDHRFIYLTKKSTENKENYNHIASNINSNIPLFGDTIITIHDKRHSMMEECIDETEKMFEKTVIYF